MPKHDMSQFLKHSLSRSAAEECNLFCSINKELLAELVAAWVFETVGVIAFTVIGSNRLKPLNTTNTVKFCLLLWMY